jgi:anti-anti-sigma factor
MPLVPEPLSYDVAVVHIEGPLRLPMKADLPHKVQGLLRSGQRRILLDLARVPAIDAAGVGELVRAYNKAAAANGRLRIVHLTAYVRVILHRVGLLRLLSADSEFEVDEGP